MSNYYTSEKRKQASAEGGRNSRGYAFGHGKVDPHEVGRKGGLKNKGRRKDGTRVSSYSLSHLKKLKREGKSQ